MANYPHTLVVSKDSERPAIVHHVKDETGALKDLTGLVSALFYMYPIQNDQTVGTIKVDGAAVTLSGLSTGEITRTPATGNHDTAGKYIAYFIGFWGATSTVPEFLGSIILDIREPWEIPPG